jgi:hypothetical protein
LLGSVERFRDANVSPLTEDIREDLLERFGLFGLRLAVRLIADGDVTTATGLANALLEHSGIRPLQRVLTERYAARAQVLKARSALVALRAIGVSLDRDAVAGGSEIVEAVDRLEASSGELALLRLQHLVLAGLLALAEDERVEIDRLTGGGDSATRVGLAPAADADEVRAAAVAGIERWRARAGNPLSDRRTIEAAEIVSRAYEAVYAATNG